MNSTNYDKIVLAKIKQFFRDYAEEGYIFMQDNVPSHRSQKTRRNLCLRQILYVKFLPYSLDLNLIKHV